MIKYVTKYVFKDNIRHVKKEVSFYYKILKANNSHNFNFVLNEWRELDSLISFSNEL